MHPSQYYRKTDEGAVICELCPHGCHLDIGKTGICRVRTNIMGELVSENYGVVSAVHLDPIEKKPLYHYYPGKKVLSIGSVGCNMHCEFCQNCEISQSGVTPSHWKKITPEDLLEQAMRTHDNIGIAYTYNEPVVYYEFMLETAKLIHENGLKNVMVSNGYINPLPLLSLVKYIDAFNIDLKGFSDEFYRKRTKTSLTPVLRTLKQIRQSGKHFEITNLVIPGWNDSTDEFENMISWINQNLGSETILHISRYFPRFKATNPSTSVKLMFKFREIAMRKLKYVYLGNVDEQDKSSDTLCPNCKTELILRTGYDIKNTGITKDGCCSNCNTKIVIC